MSDKLKPCPFCGGEAEVKKIGNEHCKKMQVKIECSTRGCFAYQQCSTLVKFGRHSWDWLSEHAIAAWNTRTVDAELQAELEEFHKMAYPEAILELRQIIKIGEDKAEEYHNQYHLCEAKLLSHKNIIRQLQKPMKELLETTLVLLEECDQTCEVVALVRDIEQTLKGGD